jgi:hypothetical protein
MLNRQGHANRRVADGDKWEYWQTLKMRNFPLLPWRNRGWWSANKIFVSPAPTSGTGTYEVPVWKAQDEPTIPLSCT